LLSISSKKFINRLIDLEEMEGINHTLNLESITKRDPFLLEPKTGSEYLRIHYSDIVHCFIASILENFGFIKQSSMVGFDGYSVVYSGSNSRALVQSSGAEISLTHQGLESSSLDELFDIFNNLAAGNYLKELPTNFNVKRELVSARSALSISDLPKGYRINHTGRTGINSFTIIPNLRDHVVIYDELSQFGKGVEGVFANLDERFSKGNWHIGWDVNGKVVGKADVLQFYEDSYYKYLKDNPHVLEWLVNTASEVYDNSLTNIDCGTDYSNQETTAAHYQDIAVRRVLQRLERKFEGNHPVQIRGHTSEGYVLNPGQVPFHKPEVILPHSNKRMWWKTNSVEAFYQHNKVIVVHPNDLMVQPDVITTEGDVLYQHTKAIYYKSNSIPLHLQKIRGRDARRLTHEGGRQLKNQERVSYSSLLIR